MKPLDTGVSEPADGRPALASSAPDAFAARRRPRPVPLRIHLTAMALAVLLPMFVLGAIATGQVVAAYKTSYKERLRATARLLSSTLDTEIESRKSAIMALADSPLLDADATGDPRPLYDYARQIGDGLGSWVSISRPDGHWLTTRFAYGTPLPPLPWRWNSARSLSYHVTDLQRVAGIDLPVVAVVGPVIRGGTHIATIAIPFASMQLAARLREGLVTSHGVLCLLDGEGNVIARTRMPLLSVGKPAPSWVRAIIGQPGQPIATGAMSDVGDTIVSIAHPSEAPNWTVVIAEPIASYDQEWVQPLLVLGGGALALLLALVLGVDRFSVWLVRPLTALSTSARLVASGTVKPSGTRRVSHVAEFEELRASLVEAGQVMQGRAEAIEVAFASARRERDLLQSVVNGKSDPTIVKDIAGKLVLANTAAAALLAAPAASMVGKVLTEPGLANAGCGEAEDRLVIRTGLPMTIERTVELGGERRIFLGNKAPWRSTAGEVLGVVAILHDITEWKRSEERLRAIQAELIRAGRLSAMGAMANGLAHELNQPLSAITNFLGAARRLLARAATANHGQPQSGYGALEVAVGAVGEACEQALRAGEIVSRLRDFIGRGTSAMRVESIGQLIADTCALAIPQDTRSRVAVHVHVDPALDTVFVDRLQIEQVLVNLVLNALQAMEGCARQELTIAASRNHAGDTLIAVGDSGPGIPEHRMDEIFEPFVTTRRDGLGMGLPIARLIVTAHGGSLTVSNNPDGGATLTLMLPAVLSLEEPADA